MRKTILGSLTSLLIPFAAYGANISYGAYQRRQSTYIGAHQPLPLANGQRHSFAERTLDLSAAELDITAGSPVRELMIIDAAVPDKAVLQSAVRPGIETFFLKAGEDALQQTAALLQNYTNLDAVHLVSHGEAGAILLGDLRVDKHTLETHPHFLKALGQATRAGADLLLYACDVASEDAELLEVIQQNSHLDVAASNNLTGAAGLGGDWTLEIQAGTIETAQAFSEKALRDFSTVLRPFGSKSLDGWGGEHLTDDPSHDWDGFTTYITTAGTTAELLDGDSLVCPNGLYASLYYTTSQFFIRSNPSGENFGVTSLNIYSNGKYAADTVSIFGYQEGNPTPVGTKTNVSLSTTPTAVSLTTGLTSGSFADIRRLRIQPLNGDSDEADFCLPSVTFTNLDTDGNVTAAAGVSEPVGLATTVNSDIAAVNVFDFTISDGGTNDDQPLTVSQLFLSVTGTSTDDERDQITWRLNGPDASNVTGTYNPATDRITFSGLSLSIADGASETYTINAYYNNNTNITDGSTVILSIDGDTNLTVGSGGTQMGSTSPVTNGTGTTLDVVATQLVFTTQPAGSVSGAALTQQPVVAARDAFGNTDIHFTETITLTEASAGTLSNNTQAASNGVATFTNLIYTATADQQNFTLTANDQDGAGSNLPTVGSNSVTSNVVATKLLFTTQPSPTSISSGVATGFTTVPVVSAMDSNDIVDTDYITAIVLSVTDPNDGTIDGTVNSLTGTGDTDGSGTTVTLTPSSGVATYSGLQLTYTAGGGSNTIALRAASGGLTADISDNITALTNNPPTDIALSASDINQSSTGAGVAVGTLSTTDADVADTHTYSLVANGASGNGSCGAAGDDNNASFQIDNGNDELETAGSLSPGNYSVCIQTSDGVASYQESFTITVDDDVAPTVSSVTVPANATYIVGQDLDFTVNTNENVTVNTTSGTPQISLTIGATPRQAVYLSGSGTSALVFRYTVQSGDMDTDGIAVGTLSANGGTLQDGAGNDLNTTLNSVGATTSVLVDAIVPTVSSVSVPANGTYIAGQNLDFTVNTNENVTVNTGGGTPQIALTVGATTRQAAYLSGSGTSALVFRYTVQASDSDTDGIALAATIDSNGGTLRDGAGNDLNTTLNTVGATTGVLVDAVAPTVSSVSVPANDTYIAGENLDFTVNTNENITVNTGGGTPQIALTIGATTRQAMYLSGSGTSALVFRYAVQAGDNDTDGIAVAASVDANGGTLRDGAGNELNTTLNSVGATTGVLVDAVAPTVTDGNISISGATGTGGTYKIGDTVTATWNNTAGGDNNNDINSVTVDFSEFGGGAAVAATDSSDTWTATYTIVAGAIDGTNLNVSVTATDNAGNGTTTADIANASVDNVAPTVTDANISISGATGDGGVYIAGDTITATWNDTGSGDNNSDNIDSVTVDFSAFGGGATVAATESSDTWTATYTIVAGAIDGTDLNVSVTATDNAGNSATTADSTDATVDNQSASISSVTLPGNDSYIEGQNLDFTVNYSEAVTVNTTGGTPRLELTIGATTRYATYTSGSGTGALLFRYTVQSSDNDNNGITLNTALDTNGGTLQDDAGNAADTNLGAIGSLASVLVDTQAPSVGSVTLPANATYTAGQNLDFTINYDETVTVTGTPRLALTVGATVRSANYISGSGTAALVFRYTVQAGDIDSDGISLNATLDANGGTLRDTAGNDAATALGAIGSLASVLVDADAPTIDSVTLPANATYTAGQNLDFTVNYDEAVTVNTGGGTPRLALTVGAAARFANYVSGSGSTALVFRYTVQAGDNDSDGIALNNTLQSNGGTLRDASGNDAGTSLGATGSLAAVLVDAQAPSVNSVNLPADGSYLAGQNLDFIVNYDEAITVTGTPRLALTIGATARHANYVGGSGTTALLFRYTAQAGDNDSNGIALNTTLDINGGTLRDTAGNDASVNLGAIGSLAAVLVDTQAPSVTSVTLPGNATYTGGQNLDFTVNYDEAVTVTGTPRLALTLGATARFANYVSGSGTTALLFRYAVQSGDNDGDGIALNTTIDANGGTLQDAAGNAAGTGLGASDLSGVLVDTQGPSITSVTLPADSTYLLGENLDFTVTYDEAVTVNTAGGTPRLALTVGATARFANYVSGSGSTALLFRYTVQAGDNDNDGIALNTTLDANGGTLRDATNVSANIDLGTIGSLAGVLVDAQAPSVDSVTLPANGSYREGQNLDFTVNYDEAVTVDTAGGTPQLALTIGATARSANYVSGSGSTALLFRYTVQAGDSDGDGIALNTTLDVNGGTLKDAAGNDADTDLGAVGDLAAVLVDTQSPSITSVTLPANATYLLGQNIDFTVNYDENVTVTGTPRLALTIGATTRYATYNSGSGTNALLFRYTAQNGDSDGDGIELDTTLDVNGGTLRDAAGNDAGTDLGANDLSGVLVDALDTDGDGVSDVQEGIDGTDPNDPDDYLDDTAPLVTAPTDLVIDATGLYTPVTLRQLLGLAPAATDEEVQQAQAALATDNIDGADCCNTRAQGLENGRILLPPGQTQIVWQGSDRKGNNGQAVQNVNIRPLVSVGKDQTGVEGSPVTFRVILNGLSPFYPLEVPFVIDTAMGSTDNTDHDLVDGTVTFNAGETMASVTINLIDDMLPEGDEVLVVRLDDLTDDNEDLAGGYDPLNINDINSGAVTQQIITVTEGNVAPNVALNMQQNAVNVALVANNGGDVTVTANVTDPNAGDTHGYDWLGSDSQLTDTDGDVTDATFVFDPALLSAGVHTVQVAVTDSGGATVTRLLHFSVVAEAPVLDPLDDTDGDGVDDVTEGIADSDGDGIPDYLDNIAAGNVLPENVDVTDAYLVECEPGVLCRLGSDALPGGGVRISSGDLPADTLYTNTGGVFDFEIHNLPVAGQSTRVVIPQIAAIPADAAYRKFSNDQWFTFVEDANNALHSAQGEAGFCPPPGDASWEPGLVEGYLCVQVTIEDGGANDADGLANGSVEDPGGVGQPVAVNPPPPSGGSSWTISGSTRGGGGALGLPAGLALLLLVLLRNGRRAAKVCGLLAALLASAAQAQEGETPVADEAAVKSMEDTGDASSRWQRLLDSFAEKGYLTLGLYQAEGDQSRGDFVGGMANDGVTLAVQEYDVSRTAYQLSLGYRYLPGMAVEFGYLDLGDVDFAFTANAANAAVLSEALSQNLPISSDGWVLSHRFDFMFGDWRTSADVGLYFWDGKASINDPAINANIKDGIDPLVGLQVAYPLTDGLELAVQYWRILFNGQKVGLWGGALSWNF